MASAGFVHFQRAVLSSSGLHAAYWAGTTWDGPPRFEIPREQIATATIQAHARAVGGPIAAEWRGFLIVPVTSGYRFAADADDLVLIEIDRRPVLSIATPGSAIVATDLTRGLHPITIRHAGRGGTPKVSLYWSRDTGPLTNIPPAFLVPDMVSTDQIRLRRALARLMPVVPFGWSLLLMAAAGIAARSLFRRYVPQPSTGSSAAVLALALAVFGTGLWWGLPDVLAWTSDELNPGQVQGAVQFGFAHGWASMYPPLHYALLALATAPFHVLSALGAVALDDVGAITAMFLVQRAVSLGMALGIVAAAMSIGGQIAPRAGFFAGVATIALLPFVYYAKTANVDLPSVFWFMLSMVFYLRARTTGATRDFLGFVVCGVAAIATKDQAYGLYVLPAIGIAVAAFRHRHSGARTPGRPSMRVFGLMALAAIAGLVVAENLLLNWDGFLAHIEVLRLGSHAFRAYENSPAGHGRMAVDALWQLGQSMTWPLLAASVAAAAAAWRSGVAPIRFLMLPLVSYYLTAVALVGYHYDRFFLAPMVLLAIALGWGIDAWLAPGGRALRLRTAAIAVLFAYALLRAAALDAIMVRDSRYAAEDWLLAHAAPGATIAGAGRYLPRRAKVFWTPLPLDLAELARQRPDFVVVNVGYSLRHVPDSRRDEFYEALASGRTAYHRVFQYRTHLPWSPLNLESRFTDAREDPTSNLSKVNPLIEVYAR